MGRRAETSEGRRTLFKKMLKASLLAGALLASMYIGLTYLASFYTPISLSTYSRRLAVVSRCLLGPVGALFSCVSVSLICLTTAIPITVVSAEYIHKDFMREKGTLSAGNYFPLTLSMLVANLGFMGIANMLSPILQVLCPGLIILFCA